MEDRITPVIHLEMTDRAVDGYVAERVPAVLSLQMSVNGKFADISADDRRVLSIVGRTHVGIEPLPEGSGGSKNVDDPAL
jgi:hypothetical protein